MKKMPAILPAVALTLILAAQGHSAQRDSREGVRSLSKKQLIELSESAAPPLISRKATIMIPGADGKLHEVRKGTNGFTCVPDIDGQDVPSPMCADEAAMRFFLDMWDGRERPTNTTVGVAYMAQGGWHWEKDGRVIMSMSKNEPGAKRVKEPPHWMIIFPFSPEKTMLPAIPTIFGSWVMFDGTPFAHLMVYQDPANLGGQGLSKEDLE